MVTSDAFLDDAYGYVTNQCGHARIGAGVCLVGLVAWPVYGEAVAVVVVALYFLAVEWWMQGLSRFWDSVEDAAHVGFGAAGVTALHHFGPIAALAVFLASLAVLGVGAGRRL